MKLRIEKRTSQKTGKTYTALIGYSEKFSNGIFLTFDTKTIMRIGNLTYDDLYNLKEPIEIN